jgi:hypothetical protein
MTRLWKALAVPAGLFVATPAVAQVDEDLLIQPEVPQNFDRGRNISVIERPRPGYSALGVTLGGFRLFPRVETSAGATSNTYLTSQDPTASAYAAEQVSAKLVSLWSRHSLQLTAATTQRFYFGQSKRNENRWLADAAVRVDVYHSFKIETDLNASQSVENLFSGAVSPTVAALSSYRRYFASFKGTYTEGRFRAFALTDYTIYNYSQVPLLTGGLLDQSDRNRRIARVTGQIEYARTPSISIFAQLSGERTTYDRDLLSGLPNLDSKAARLLFGANIDIAARIRGTIGVGYSARDYDASLYKSVHGLSVESQLQFFPSDRLTIGLTSQRTLNDSSIGTRQPYWNTQFDLRGDYELLRNLIVALTGDFSRQSYIDNPLESETYQANLSVRYLASRRVNLRGAVSYGQRTSNNTVLLGSLHEARFEAGIAYQL